MDHRRRKRIVMKSPATARFARQVTEKDLTIRFLTMKLIFIDEQLVHMMNIKSPSQRLNEVRKLRRDVSKIISTLNSPRHNMTFYKRRAYIV